jgi:hypothetical protein
MPTQNKTNKKDVKGLLRTGQSTGTEVDEHVSAPNTIPTTIRVNGEYTSETAQIFTYNIATGGFGSCGGYL